MTSKVFRKDVISSFNSLLPSNSEGFGGMAPLGSAVECTRSPRLQNVIDRDLADKNVRQADCSFEPRYSAARGRLKSPSIRSVFWPPAAKLMARLIAVLDSTFLGN